MSKGFVELESGLIVPAERPEPPDAKRHSTMDLESKGTPQIRHQNVKQIREWPPTTDSCEKDETLFRDDDQIAFATWHPQWGGYCGKCVVEATVGDVGGCFQAINWHDGEFPRDESYVEYHYCAPAQLIEFGTTILEKQLGDTVVLSRGANTDGLRELAARIIALCDKTDGMEQLC